MVAGDRLGVELRLQRGSPDRGRHRTGHRRRTRRHLGCGRHLRCHRLLLARWRGCRAAPARQFEPVHLADDRIARDGSELSRDLAGAEALRPEFLEKFDPLVSPVHSGTLLVQFCRSRNPSTSRHPPGRHHIYAGEYVRRTKYSFLLTLNYLIGRLRDKSPKGNTNRFPQLARVFFREFEKAAVSRTATRRFR